MALEKTEEIVYGLGNRSIASEVSQAGSLFMEFYDQLGQLPTGGSIVGVPSGLHALDNMTRGFQRSDLIIMAGRPAMGKTSLAMTMARNAAIQYNYGVLVFSCEMSKMQLIQRLVALQTGINVQRLFTKQLDSAEIDHVASVGHIIDEAPLWIDDTPGLTIAAMRSKIRRMLAEHQIDFIIVDYLQLMQATIDGKRIKDRLQEVSEVARSLKNVAREFNLPILALAQLSRAVEGRAEKIPQLSDLRESGELEQAADIVMFIHRDDYYAGYDKETGESRSNRPKTADIIIAKHRNGPVGEVLVGFEASQTKFCNLEEMPR
jgi:replicative DNA helicase